jgi:hypothetical protein
MSPQTWVVVGVLTALIGLATGVGQPFLHSGPFSPSFPLPWWALALAFAATEANVLHLQVERQARSVSLSELPVVVALFFAAPSTWRSDGSPAPPSRSSSSGAPR